MAFKLKEITLEKFKQRQYDFSCSNFLQSAQTGHCQKERPVYIETEIFEITKDNEFIGQFIINYRKKYKFLKSAVIYHGPLLDYSKLDDFKEALKIIENHVKKKANQLIITTYLPNKILNEKFEVTSTLNDGVVDILKNNGFNQYVDIASANSIGQIFVKPLKEFNNIEEIYNSFPNSLKRDLKKFSESHVKVRELAYENIDEFYDILEKTSKRKNFIIHPFKYFQLLKQYFGKDVKFMEAYLDCIEYKKYLNDNIESFNKKIEELSTQAQTKKIKGYITDAKDQLGSYIKRLNQFNELNITKDTLPLSSYMFMCYGKEVITVFGGSYDEYINFGGSTILNWEMIQYAFNEGYERFNFYGTIEANQVKNATGNYNFKKQFGGELIVLTGTFTKNYGPLIKIIQKFKK